MPFQPRTNADAQERLVAFVLAALTNPQYGLAGEVLREVEEARRRRSMT